jgi:hypothetical protein
MILGDFESRVSWHLVLEGILILAVVAEEDILIHVEHAILDVLLSKGSKQFSIEIVSDSATVEHLADHVLKHGCVDLLDLVLLRRGADEVVQVFLDEAERGLQIGVVELVGHAPSQGTELSSFDDHGVQVADGEDQILPVGVVNLLQEFLVDHGGEGLVETCLKALGRLVGDLDDFLQQAKRESIVRLAGNPESEVLMRLLGIGVAERDDQLFGLLHELETELAVLKDDPSTGFHTGLDGLPCRLFLALAH